MHIGQPKGNRICLDCEAIIPLRRVELINAVRCVYCQMAMEQRNKGCKHV